MKKLKSFAIIFAVLFLNVTTLRAAQVDVNVASQVAANFYRQLAPVSAAPQLALASRTALAENRGDVTCFYIFNIETGFVIVAGDDKVRPVLAYSTESNFDTQSIPAHIQFFLDSYRDEILAIIESPTTDNQVTAAAWSELLRENQPSFKDNGTPVVGPLLTTKWAQTGYYNQLCPADASSQSGHCLVGCGAMVMGQVMHYWKYPVTGTGSHSYTCSSYGLLSANFGATTYGYSAMPNQLSSTSSASQVMSTATLLYHCGVAVDMNYGPNSSYSNSNKIVSAFSTYFCFPDSVEYLERSYYLDGIWLNMVKAELDVRAPFLYGGSGSYGGHVWVCDGYTDENYLHFNWGWNGSYNGYFAIGDFTPGPYDFNSSHAMIRGIRGPQLPESIADDASLNMTLYPNPATESLFVELEDNNPCPLSITITDMTGRILISQSIQPANNNLIELNISNLSRGLYLLCVDGTAGKNVQKFVVK